jgi:hypothetical protein
MQVAAIARFYKKYTSTIFTVLNKKKELRGLDVAKEVMRVSKQWPRILEDVEKLLFVWINGKQLAGDTVTENLGQQIAVIPLVTMKVVLPNK